MALLLYVFNPDPVFAARVRETQAILRKVGPRWQQHGHGLVWVPVGPDARYEQVVLAHWGQQDLIILEHDVVPTWGHLIHLTTCPYPLCTVAYPLNQPMGPGQFHGELVQRTQLPNGRRRWLPYGTPWADYTGLGLVRFRQAWMQSHVPSWAPGQWSDLDARISWWTHRLHMRWHVHYPLVRHHHYGEGYVPA